MPYFDLLNGVKDDTLDHVLDTPSDVIWVRAVMISDLTGNASGTNGLSGSLGTPADKRAFDAARRWADVVLVGAETVRAEQYSPSDDGPSLAIVTRSADLPDDVLDHHLTYLVGPDMAATHPRGLDLSGDQWVNVFNALAAHGLPRIACEGGPTLVSQLAAHGHLTDWWWSVRCSISTSTAPLMPAACHKESPTIHDLTLQPHELFYAEPEKDYPATVIGRWSFVH